LPSWLDAASAAPPQEAQPAPGTVIPLADDPERFRAQMIDFLHDTEKVLGRGLQHPVLGQRIELALNAQMLEVPFPAEVYAGLENATTDELLRLRGALAGAPGFLSTAEILDSALALVPGLPDAAVAATCGTNYEEWNSVVSKTSVVRGLTIAYDTVGFVYSIFNTITEVAGATTEDTPYVGKIPSIPFIVIRGVLGVVQQSIGFARSDIGYQINLSELCLASCLSDDGDVHGQPSKFWRGRGCDNRDNNCADGIDDGAEDLFPPAIVFDAAIIGSCFGDVASAQAAADLAAEATDDCSRPTSSVTLGPVSAQDCKTLVSVTARDRSNNVTDLTGAHLALTVDGQAPQVTPAALNACYASMGAARAAFTGPGLSIADCTDVATSVEAVEKECVADFRLTAVDACGNQTTIGDTVRVDGSAPEVDIRRLLIPAVSGLACFGTQQAAQQAVEEATVASDNCTLPEDLVRNTTLSGDACNLEIRESVTDECGQTSSDALTVRVDAAPPVVSCAVAQDVLYPANDEMVDIGFSYQATDNCEPDGPQIDVEVLSDEPTFYAYSVIAGADPSPDAVVERGAGGTITRILLRAQRSQTKPADGRVYRIRLLATDSCGLRSHADCYVTVPRTSPGPGSAVNSGLDSDATVGN
jgi:hypothetical protein